MDGLAQLIGILDSKDENRRLELVLEVESEPRLALKLATYAEGLGWHAQKTIYIDMQQAEQMQFLLGGARHLLKQAEQRLASENGSCERSESVEATGARIRQFPAAARRSA